MKKCPNCQLQHLDEVSQCECGYRFLASGTDEVAASKNLVRLRAIVAIIGVLILGPILAKYVNQYFDSKSVSTRSPSANIQQTTAPVELQLATLAMVINSKNPHMIDSSTNMDKAIAGPGLTMTYLYTLPDHAAGELDQTFIREATEQIKNHACGSRPLVNLLNQGVTATYIYRGNDEKEIVRTVVHDIDC